jgi:hypothetical protein
MVAQEFADVTYTKVLGPVTAVRTLHFLFVALRVQERGGAMSR